MLRPSPTPDELFHHAISGWLLEWAESQRVSPYTVNIVGESWSGRAYELREVLGGCAIPHAFSLADSETGARSSPGGWRRGRAAARHLPGRTVLRDPTNAEIVEASGSPVDPAGAEFDLVIVGAGPAGLSAAVYGASEGFSTLVVDEGGIGGQATSSSLDPQLPRLRSWRERAPARPAGVRAGVGVRRELRLHAARSRSSGVTTHGLAVTLSDSGSRAPPRGAARDGRRLPTARHPRARGAERRRRLLRRHRVRGARRWPAATST